MRIILLLLALLVPVSAQETMIRQVFDTKTDTHVEVLALFTQPSRGGFFPVRVKISNNLDIPRSAQLDFASSANYSNQLSTKSSFSFTAPAKKTVTQDIMVPIGVPASTYDNTNISTTLSGSLGSANHSTRVETSADSPAVLLSEALFTPNASSLDAENKKKSGSSYGNANFAGKFDPKQLPSDWLAFSGYDSVLMSDNDWSNVPPGARNAIQSWMNLGGQLVIFSSSNASIATLGISKDPGFGSCLIKNIGSDHKLDPDETLNLVFKQNPVRKRVESIITDYDGTWPLPSHFGSQAFHYGIFIAVLILFAILVGPVNLFVLAKSDRRHRLFITTPIISLGASLLLIALIIFQDGFGGNGIRQILMEVRPDAGQNAAFLHQEQISRTGVLMSNSFNVDPACLLAPVPISKSRWARFTSDSNTRGSFNLQPSNGKMAATGDWFQSRSEHGHAISAVVSTRGRIERTADPLVCVSTFDFPIETLYFLNEKDQWHRAESITTGKPFNLTPIDATMAEPALAAQANAFATRNREIFARAKNRPNHFIALTDKAPGIDTLQGIKWRQTHTVITGPVTSP